jgi:hypothetical protein
MLGQLDSKRFAVREKATQQLEQLGERASPALRKALAAGPALEVRQRIEQLLEKLSKPVASTDLLRGLRAIEILEQVGTATARQVLESLARGDPEARLTRDARDALARLSARNRVGP